MIVRIALFITLLATFYYYCREDSNSNQFRGPNDINMIEVPKELSPVYFDPSVTAQNFSGDSSYLFPSESEFIFVNYSNAGLRSSLK
jgi:hypothetical protein